MSQATDYSLANQSGASFRTELNSVLGAIATQNSGATEPTTMYAYMWWADTSSGLLKIRNAANNGWVTVGTLASLNLGLAALSGATMTGLFNFAASTDIASAATVDLTAATGNVVTITGTTTVTAFTMNTGQVMFIVAEGALPLTYNATTMNIAGGASYTAEAGDRLLVFKDVDNVIRVNVFSKALIPKGHIQDIDASVASNALTITINPTTLQFRSTTLTDGTPETVNLSSAVTVVVPNTATLGTINATAARLAVLAINNAGTIEAAVVNLAGGNQLDETNLISTTAIGTGSDSNNVIYSTTGRSNVPYRVVGFIDITEATAGVWATAPTLVQGAGGNAITALSSLGYGQTWQDVTGSRSSGVTYYNTTGKPIYISAYNNANNASCSVSITVNGVVVSASVFSAASQNGRMQAGAIVPPGASYSYASTGGVAFVAELR